tara:strand:- start:556 stop:1152 length:597 start_codon:yes stop_codon:yes gene_type:complete
MFKRDLIVRYIPQTIKDILVVELDAHEDDRGYFAETFRKDDLSKSFGHDINFVQENESKSLKGVLRGLHFQVPPYSQSKLVRVIDGSVLDVAVDIRKGSPSYGKYIMVELTGENKKQIFIPRGFAHGFLVLSDTVTFSYKVDNYYSSVHEHGLSYDDEDIGIDWKINRDKLILSDRDKQQPKLKNLNNFFSYKDNYYD